MGIEFSSIENTGRKAVDLSLKAFYGGNDFGEMLQLTQGLGSVINNDEPGFIQLTIFDTYRLISKLAEWIKDSSHKKALKIQAEIDKHEEMKGTIFEEAVKCEKFISDLKILEIPLYLLGK